MTTEDIAKKANINHSSIMKLACNYLDILKEFGDLKIEKVSSSKGHGGRNKKIIELNKQQEISIVFLLRNTDSTVELKKEYLGKLLKGERNIG